MHVVKYPSARDSKEPNETQGSLVNISIPQFATNLLQFLYRLWALYPALDFIDDDFDFTKVVFTYCYKQHIMHLE